MSTKRCAAWCGLGCTEEQYQEAKKRATALAERLGPTWTIDVWENLGWHSAVLSENKTVKVHFTGSGQPTGIFGGGEYLAFIGDARDGSGGGDWTAHRRTARAAVNAVIRTAQAERARINVMLEGLE